MMRKKEDKGLDAFAPAVFDMNHIMAILERGAGEEVKDPLKLDPKKEKRTKEARLIDKKTDFVKLHPFARIDLRIGRIVKVDKHPQADLLYIEQVDLGEMAPRTVISKLVEHVPIEELQDQLCVFICNLKPASICKVLSSAMLLTAKTDDGNSLEPLVPPANAKAGDQIVVDGIIPHPDEVIKPKDNTWEDVRSKLKIIDGAAHYENLPLKITDKGGIISRKIKTGVIS